MARIYQFLTCWLVLVVIVGFFNCTDQSPRFIFQESTNVVASIRSEENVTGGSYLGKPIEGEYVRTFAGFKCANQQSVQGNLNVSTNVHIFKDNCHDTSIDFGFADALLDFSSYNQAYLGVGTAIYELSAAQGNSLEVTEVWCKYKSSSISFDVVAKVNSSLSEAQAKVYLGIASGSRVTAPIQVNRSQTGNSLVFTSQSISLQVQKSAASDQFSLGHATMLVDDIKYDQDVTCRVADIAPIEEMGVGLTKLYPINSFVTDGQEALCAHPGVLSCDNMEDRVSGVDLLRAKFANLGWQMQPGQVSLISPVAFDGVRSLEMPMAANSGGSGNIGFGFAATPELYTRFYIKWSANFQFSNTATGLMTFRPNNPSQVLFTFDSNRFLSLNESSISPSTFQPNVNQWYCIESHLKTSSTAGARDAVIELWVDNAKVFDARNLNVDGVFRDWGYFGNWFCADANSDGICDTATHPAQSVFIDNLVAAKQRIGCF